MKSLLKNYINQWLNNHATKKKLKHGRGVDTSNSAVKRDFIALKTKASKLDIDRLI